MSRTSAGGRAALLACAATVALLALGRAATAGAPPPNIVVDRTSGPSSTIVTIRGSGWQNGEPVEVDFGGAFWTHAAAQPDGSFSVAAAVPGGPDGDYQIQAHGPASGASNVVVFHRASSTPTPTPSARPPTPAPTAPPTTGSSPQSPGQSPPAAPANPPPALPGPITSGNASPIVFRFVITPADALTTLPSDTGVLLAERLTHGVGGLNGPIVATGSPLVYSSFASTLDVGRFDDLGLRSDIMLITVAVRLNGRDVHMPASLAINGPSEFSIVLATAYRVTVTTQFGSASYHSDGEVVPGFVRSGSTVHYMVTDDAVRMDGIWGAVGGTRRFSGFEDGHGRTVPADEVIRAPLHRVAVWHDDDALPALAVVGLGVLLMGAGAGVMHTGRAVLPGTAKGERAAAVTATPAAASSRQGSAGAPPCRSS